MTRRTWFLVTVTLTWDASDDAVHADRVLDRLLEHEGMAGARVPRAVELGPASMYYRIDVRARSEADAREQAVAAGLGIARRLGSKAAVTDVQTMSGVELGAYQGSISH